MNGIYLILGSNLGDKILSLKKAVDLIRKRIGNVVVESSYYETEPWGYSEQANFLNKAIKIETEYAPDELLEQIDLIEKELGRVRKEKWHERELDIDILYYGDDVIRTGSIQIPHPEIAKRRFVLIPMCEIAPDEKHPVTGKTQMQMLLECRDTLKVKKLNL
jgi:2-amino-4-hydroxy-6-hydroxymethyldihydropteridine diphosphokinase